MINLQRAIGKVETAIDSAITPAGIFIEPVLEAARLVADGNRLFDIFYPTVRDATARRLIADLQAALTPPGEPKPECPCGDGR